MNPSSFLKALLTGSTLFAISLSGPALADVRTGVELWSQEKFAEAVQQWQSPCDAGDPDACFNLGQAYKLGRGIARDLTRAEQLYNQAAAKGHLLAADNYGLLLFQRGERSAAMPYIRAASERDDPRAHYLLGIAYFNGDLVEQNWPRAYALMTLAQEGQLAPATSALQQMDQLIPLPQRQEGIALSTQIAAAAEANRARQSTAFDFQKAATENPAQPPRTPSQTAENRPDTPKPASAYRNNPAPLPSPPRIRRQEPYATARTAQPPRATTQPRVATGPWKVQLGAFSQMQNLNTLWNRVRNRPELAGSRRIVVSAGGTNRLQAGGFATEAAARSACSKLTSAGISCVIAR